MQKTDAYEKAYKNIYKDKMKQKLIEQYRNEILKEKIKQKKLNDNITEAQKSFQACINDINDSALIEPNDDIDKQFNAAKTYLENKKEEIINHNLTISDDDIKNKIKDKIKKSNDKKKILKTNKV